MLLKLLDRGTAVWGLVASMYGIAEKKALADENSEELTVNAHSLIGNSGVISRSFSRLKLSVGNGIAGGRDGEGSHGDAFLPAPEHANPNDLGHHAGAFVRLCPICRASRVRSRHFGVTFGHTLGGRWADSWPRYGTQVVLLLYVLITVPLRVAFDADVEFGSAAFWFDVAGTLTRNPPLRVVAFFFIFLDRLLEMTGTIAGDVNTGHSGA